jgi:hypothetical protein
VPVAEAVFYRDESASVYHGILEWAPRIAIPARVSTLCICKKLGLLRHSELFI